MEKLKCIKCEISKEKSCFIKDNRLTSGYRSKCKTCLNEEQSVRRFNSIEKYKATRQLYYQANIEKMRAEKIEYYKNNKEAKALYDIQYRETNKEKIALYKKEWDKKQMENNIVYKLKKNLRRRVHHALNGNTKSQSTMNLLGCTPEFFKSHLESLFLENMSWDNYGEWHIDHTLPCYTFDLSCPVQQKECFHYSNQRPLWKTDNLKRSKSIVREPKS